MASARHRLRMPTTQYVMAANSVKFAYRFHNPSEPSTQPHPAAPLVLQIHFRGTMAFWDPLLLATLARTRSVISFDNAGIGQSTGTVPTTFQGWADDLIAFVDALGLETIDLLGFSMGGAAVQMVALTRPTLVRKLILAGTTASQPREGGSQDGIVWPREMAPSKPIRLLARSATVEEDERAIAYSFFPDDDRGREAAKEYWLRVQPSEEGAGQQETPRLEDGKIKGKRQMAAMLEWSAHSPRNSVDRLQELKMPVLICNGDDDALIPTSRSWELLKRIDNAQLIIYPRSGHGFLWQYAEWFGKDVNAFLDRDQSSEVTTASTHRETKL